MDKQLECPKVALDLSVNSLGKVCKYHKLAHQEFNAEETSSGICPILHNSVYPQGLSALYGGGCNGTFRCPINEKVQAQVVLRKKWSLPVYGFYWLLIKVTRVIGLPWDCELYDVYYEIDGDSSCAYHGGKEARRFNSDNRQQLCPATYYTILPALMAGVETVHCVDHQGISYNTNSGKEPESSCSGSGCSSSCKN